MQTHQAMLPHIAVTLISGVSSDLLQAREIRRKLVIVGDGACGKVLSPSLLVSDGDKC